MLNLVPTRVFLTKGVGRHKYQLKSFEEALRKAGVAQQNLVQVSSILPPHCKIISKERGLKLLTPGGICHCVMARADTDEHGRLVASSVGIAVPKDETKWGYLSEVHGHGMNEKEASDLAEDLAAGMLGTTLGLEVDPNKAWSREGAGVQIQRPDHSHLEHHPDRPRQERPLDHDGGDRHVPVRFGTATCRRTTCSNEHDPTCQLRGLAAAVLAGPPTPGSSLFPCPTTERAPGSKGRTKARRRSSGPPPTWNCMTSRPIRKSICDGIFTDEPVAEDLLPSRMVEAVRRRVQGHLANRKLVVVVGGEHSVSIGAVQAHVEPLSRPERPAARRPLGFER